MPASAHEDCLSVSADTRIRVLFDAEMIAARNHALAKEVKAAAPENLLVVAVLKGSFIFAADLIRALHDVESEMRGRDVLLIDDILESGRTLAYAKDLFAARGARRVLTCVLLEKPGKRAVSLNADFVGFQCPDLFVVGYGMDVAHAYRQLPFVGVVEKNT